MIARHSGRNNVWVAAARAGNDLVLYTVSFAPLAPLDSSAVNGGLVSALGHVARITLPQKEDAPALSFDSSQERGLAVAVTSSGLVAGIAFVASLTLSRFQARELLNVLGGRKSTIASVQQSRDGLVLQVGSRRFSLPLSPSELRQALENFMAGITVRPRSRAEGGQR